MSSADLLIDPVSSCKYTTEYFHTKPNNPKKWCTERVGSHSSSCHRNKKRYFSNLVYWIPSGQTFFWKSQENEENLPTSKEYKAFLFLALHKQIKIIVPAVLSTVKALLYLNSSCSTDAPTLFSLNNSWKKHSPDRCRNKIF